MKSDNVKAGMQQAPHRSLFNALGYSLGFFLALMLMAGIREKLDTCRLPKTMIGTPIALVMAGIMSLAFMAFKGMAQ